MSSRPSRFGPYELVRRLGAGGMAETFLAVRRGPGSFEQQVCLKRILPAFEKDQEFVRLFLEEARIAAKLRHASIAQVLDFGVVDGSHYLTLELIEGMDLRELLRAAGLEGKPVTTGLVSYLAVELATALDFAHGQGVVHRDISPSNVLVSRAGEVKLTDFGIAKAMTGGTATMSGVIKGKVPYMAPEYARTARSDPRCDLFALGVVLYEALAGKRPYDGVTDLDTLSRSSDGSHVPISQIAPTAPRVLADAIERLIKPDPAARFASAGDLLDALVDVAPPPTSRRILGELVKRLAAQTATPADSGPAAFEDTLHATPKGTVILNDAMGSAPAAAIHESKPGDATRTRMPQRGEAAAASAGEGGTRTQLDPAMAEAHAVAALPTKLGAARGIEDAATKQLDTPVARESTVVGHPRGARGPAVWLGIGAVVVLVGVSAWLVGGMGSGEEVATVEPDPPRTVPGLPEVVAPVTPVPAVVPTPTPPTAPVTATDTDTDTATDTATDTDTDTDTATATATDPDRNPTTGRATLVVAVVPYGNVWVDGRRRGVAPQTVRVRPGRHTVEGGDDTPTRRQVVHVEAGQTLHVRLQ